MEASAIRARARPFAQRVPDWALPLAVWLSLIAVARALVAPLVDRNFRVHLGNPPLAGALTWHAQWWLLVPAALALAAVVYAPRLALSLSWRRLLSASWGAGVAWTLSLAAADGWHEVSLPLLRRYDYLRVVPEISSPGQFLSSFTDRLSTYPTHVKGHPPGLPLFFWGLRQIGLGSGDAAALVVIAVGALAAPAVLLALRELAGEGAARTAAPFLALAPAAIYMGTSGDAVFAGVSAIGIALFVLATGAEDRRADRLALGAGVVLALALHLSYGIAPLLAIPVAVAVARRAVRPMLLALAGAGVVVIAFVVAGFWWLDGLSATHDFYASGISKDRPYAVFLIASPAAFALALGPAVAVGLSRLRTHGVWLLAGGALAALAFADLSGLSRGETERIWLPFAPWLLASTAAFAGRPRAVTDWLAAQLALGLLLQGGTNSLW